jgi:hypothetical protein
MPLCSCAPESEVPRCDVLRCPVAALSSAPCRSQVTKDIVLPSLYMCSYGVPLFFRTCPCAMSRALCSAPVPMVLLNVVPSHGALMFHMGSTLSFFSLSVSMCHISVHPFISSSKVYPFGSLSHCVPYVVPALRLVPPSLCALCFASFYKTSFPLCPFLCGAPMCCLCSHVLLCDIPLWCPLFCAPVRCLYPPVPLFSARVW